MGLTAALAFLALGTMLIILGIAANFWAKGNSDRAIERDAPAHNALHGGAVLAAQPLGTPRPGSKYPGDEIDWKKDGKTEAQRAADKGLNDVTSGWIKWARNSTEVTSAVVPTLDDMEALVRHRPALTATLPELQAELVRLRGAIEAAELHRRTDQLLAAMNHVAARITLLREDTYDPSAVEDLYYLTHTDPGVVQAYIKGTEEGMEAITKEVIAARAGIRTALSRQVTGRGQGESLKALVHELALRDPAEEWNKLYNET